MPEIKALAKCPSITIANAAAGSYLAYALKASMSFISIPSG